MYSQIYTYIYIKKIQSKHYDYENFMHSTSMNMHNCKYILYANNMFHVCCQLQENLYKLSKNHWLLHFMICYRKGNTYIFKNLMYILQYNTIAMDKIVQLTNLKCV